MVQKKLKLLNLIHTDDVINAYRRVLLEMLNSTKPGERRDAVKIITDIMLKTETPKEASDPSEQKMTAEILVNKLRKEREGGGSEEDEEDSAEPSEQT